MLSMSIAGPDDVAFSPEEFLEWLRWLALDQHHADVLPQPPTVVTVDADRAPAVAGE